MEEEENVEEEAKRWKREADSEENMEVKCTKYLQVFCIGFLQASSCREMKETHSALLAIMVFTCSS